MNQPEEARLAAGPPVVASPVASAEAGSVAGHLLDREMPPGYREDWTTRIASAAAEDATGVLSTLVFRLGEEWLALTTSVLQEVVNSFVVRGVPHRRNGTLLGMVNVRGEILLCVSLRATLGQGTHAQVNLKAGRLLVMNQSGGRLALLVDEIAGIFRYHPNDLLDLPATLSGDAAQFTSGLLNLGGRTVGCLNPVRVLAGVEGAFS